MQVVTVKRNGNSVEFPLLPRPHGFLLNLIKSLQPVLAILCGVLQQKERDGGHRVSDVADMPFAALPDRTKVRRFFAWIVTFAGTQLLETNSDRRGQPTRRSFLQDAHAAV